MARPVRSRAHRPRGAFRGPYGQAFLGDPLREAAPLGLARRIVQKGLSVRAAEQAARWAGARQKPRRRAPVDPALAARARTATAIASDDRESISISVPSCWIVIEA